MLGEPTSEEVKSSKAQSIEEVHRDRQIMFAVIAIVVGIFAALVVTGIVFVYCRRGRVLLIPKVGTGYSNIRTRKRVVVMHSNVLYHPGSGGKDSDSTLPFLPVVKIEAGVTRLTSRSTAVSEYEIPLDTDWEFPRDK